MLTCCSERCCYVNTFLMTVLLNPRQTDCFQSTSYQDKVIFFVLWKFWNHSLVFLSYMRFRRVHWVSYAYVFLQFPLITRVNSTSVKKTKKNTNKNQQTNKTTTHTPQNQTWQPHRKPPEVNTGGSVTCVQLSVSPKANRLWIITKVTFWITTWLFSTDSPSQSV